jgi:WD40 repeat protein
MRSWPAALTALLLLTSGQVLADSGRTTPGLVIETGARHAVSDGISFTPDASELFAWGEDKVIRRWEVGLSGFKDPRSKNLRWPILREQRGSIFALAHSHDGKRVAVGGIGVKTGLVAVINKDAKPGDTGAIPSSLPSAEVNWSIAWSKDDRHVVYGNEKGQVFIWEPGSKAPPAHFTASGKGEATNPVRLITFVGSDHFLSVSSDGRARKWDRREPTAAPSEVGKFRIPNIFRAALSPDGKWVAAAGISIKSTSDEVEAVGKVELIDLTSDDATPVRIEVPTRDNFRPVRCLAFDASSSKLAVGCQEVPKSIKEKDFHRVVGGSVILYDLARRRWSESSAINLSYRAEALAFHPKRSSVLAVSGGESHEIALYNALTGKELGKSAVIRGPANCVWTVAFSKNGRYFAWKDHRAKEPTGRNDWGAGEWRVFDRFRLEVKASPPKDFEPAEPIARYGGWSVEPTRSAGVWEVVGPGTRVRLEGSLYHARLNQTPRCWTFIPPAVKGGPVRLAVGHQWGLSLYECSPGEVKLARLMSGHEGEVMSVAPSPDGKLLLTGARDLTVCCWSLSPWKAGTEMGAGFAVKDGKLVVTAVDTGSPAWEPLNPLRGTDEEANRLKAGDVIDLLYVREENFVYDPQGFYDGEVKKGRLLRLKAEPTRDAKKALAVLNATRPAREYILAKRIGGMGDLVYKLTTVRQRPLWRFFATRADTGNEWVIWRPRDFYYDTSANGDQFVGWHVNDPNLAAMPAFHPLERYRGTDRVGKGGARNGFHRKDKIWPELFNPTPVVDPVVFTDIEAPKVDVSVLKPAAGAAALEIQLSATPQDATKAQQRFTRVVVYVNETELPDPGLKPNMAGVIANAKVSIPSARLKWGDNHVKVVVFNEAGGRGEAEVTTEYTPPGKPSAVLHALCVGINDYKDEDNLPSLKCSEKDATEVAALLQEHTRSGAFGKASVTLLLGKKATAQAILKALDEIGKKARPDDWILVFLSGHGDVEYVKDAGGKFKVDVNKKRIPIEGTYFYPGQDFNEKKPETRLTMKQMFSALAKADGRKLVVLDTCHSGGAAVIPSDSARDVSPDGMRYMVIASCQTDQEALEPETPDAKFPHGFFTQALLDIVKPARKGNPERLAGVPSTALKKQLPEELTRVLGKFGVQKGSKYEDRLYYPAFLIPRSEEGARVFHKPGKEE